MYFEAFKGLFFLGLVFAFLFYCLYLDWRDGRERQRKRNDRAYLEQQRRMLGITPGAGANWQQTQSPRTFPKRCPRGVCTNPGASCPRECVEAPIVKRLVDGRLVHVYENVEITFDSSGEILEVKVDGRAWA